MNNRKIDRLKMQNEMFTLSWMHALFPLILLCEVCMYIHRRIICLQCQLESDCLRNKETSVETAVPYSSPSIVMLIVSLERLIT